MDRLMPLILVVALAVCIGCAGENLPTYPRLPVEKTRTILANRAKGVKTVSAEGTITLTRPDGESIRFDGALVIQPPDRSRMRAWKFGQAIFDLTLTPDGVWLVAPRDTTHGEDIRRAGATAADFAGTFSSLMGSFFGSNDLTAVESSRVIRFTHARPDGSALTCEVDRRTLTQRRYALIDAGIVRRFTLVLDRYELVQSIPWPRRIIADSSGGRIAVDLRNVEINTDLPPSAFAPPRRAEKLK